MAEGRTAFHRELERLEISVGGLLGLVPDAVVTATAAALSTEREAAAGVARWRALVEELHADLERSIEVLVARQTPVAGDLRFVLACLRLAPNLHEVVDLLGEVANPGILGLGADLPGRLVSLTRLLGSQAADVWGAVGELWADRDARSLQSVREGVDGLAETRSAIAGELASGSVPLPVALEAAVVARTLDRVGRTARSAATVISPLVPAPRLPAD